MNARVWSALGALLLVCGCGVGAAHRGPPLDYVVAEPAARFDRIRAGDVDLPPEAVRALAPLVAARTFPEPSPLADYGLDHPLLTLTYLRAGSVVVTVELGGANFDGHGYYAQRLGARPVFLVLRDAVIPALRASGIMPAPLRDATSESSVVNP